MSRKRELRVYRKPNLIVLKPRNVPIVSQYDLEELMLLNRKMQEATSRWKIKYGEIRSALLSGASVESGVHTVHLATNLVIR